MIAAATRRAIRQPPSSTDAEIARLPRLALRPVATLCAYTVTCAVLHGLLQQHYLTACRSSWLALFSVDPGPYCAFVRRGLHVLQWSPLLALGLWAPREAIRF